jgi:hypothetical protein
MGPGCGSIAFKEKMTDPSSGVASDKAHCQQTKISNQEES